MRIILSLCLMLLSVQAMAEESAYDRVMRTNEIRCGYGIYAPWIQKDLVTGEIKGVMADVAEAVAKQLDMKLVWGEESPDSNSLKVHMHKLRKVLSSASVPMEINFKTQVGFSLSPVQES